MYSEKDVDEYIAKTKASLWLEHSENVGANISNIGSDRGIKIESFVDGTSMVVDFKCDDWLGNRRLVLCESQLKDREYILDMFFLVFRKLVARSMAQRNIDGLNLVLRDLAQIKGYDYCISFRVSSEIMCDIDKGNVVYGVNVGNALNVGNLRLFKVNELGRCGYEEILSDIFQRNVPSYSFINDKNDLTLGLGIYTRKGIISILKSKYRSKATEVKVGKRGYVVCDDWFCLLERVIDENEADIVDSVDGKFYRQIIKPINKVSGNRMDVTVQVMAGQVKLVAE